MTDRTQFEAMLEALINEDQETAKEIFHNIVVAKSREIYEELLAEDFSLEESDDEEKKDIPTEEGFPSADDEEGADDTDSADDAEDDEEGDATDDFASDDEEGDEFGGEGEGELEDRVMDLEDALDELKAEFEELMAGEDDMGDMDSMGDMDGGDMDGMDMGPESELDEIDGAEMVGLAEYVNKVSLPKHGDNGANTKSAVAGKNDMGGTTANIARGDTEKGVEANKGQLKGNGVFKGSKPQLQDGGNINVPGANVGKSAFKKKETATKAQDAENKKSIVGSRK
jgi:hypothetical protein